MLFGKFASRKSEAKYPNLRDGLQVSLYPSIQSPSGIRIYDFSGRNQSGIITNANLGTFWDRTNGVLFDAIDDQVTLPAISLSSFTISLMIRHGSGNELGDAISNRVGGAGGTTPGFVIGAAGAYGQWWYFVDNGSAYFARYTVTRTSLFDNNVPTHHAMVFDAHTGVLTVYVNGIDVTSSLSSLGGGFTGQILSSQPVLVGARPSLAGRVFSGNIDAVNIWHRTLSPREVALIAKDKRSVVRPKQHSRHGSVVSIVSRRSLSHRVGSRTLQ